MTSQNRLLRHDSVAVDQFPYKRLAAIARSRWPKRARGFSMAREIWRKHAQILVRQILRQMRHDAFVRRHSVKQDDVTLRCPFNWPDNIHTHLATRRAGNDKQRLVW